MNSELPPGAARELTIADLRFDPPRLPPERLADIAATLYGISGACELLEGERDQNARITAADGRRYVLKIAGANEEPAVVDLQVQALLHLERQDPGLAVPRLVQGRAGKVVHTIETAAGTHAVRMVGFLPGVPYQDGPFPSPAGLRAIGAFVARLGRALRGFSHPAARHFMPWDIAGGLVFNPQLRELLPESLRPVLEPELARMARDVFPRLAALRVQVVHQDAHGANLLRESPASERVAGIIDFGDMILGPLICDLAACASHFIEEGDDPVRIAGELSCGYHAVQPLEPDELAVLRDLVMVRQIMTLELFEFRRRNTQHPPAFVIRDQPGLIASLERLAALEPGSFLRHLEEACGMSHSAGSRDATNDAALLRRRERALGPAYHLFYDEPLHLVRGEGVWLFDAAGRRYLDCYNNVASVGHCHPDVVAALCRQAATLNTHTRYLDENIVRYAERLAATMPDALEVCMFVCTGTEANDLAFRIARTVTGNDGAIVTEDAYHGNSMTVTALSTAEYPAAERPDWLAAVAPPNPYRGPYRYGEAELGPKYAALVDGAIERLAQCGTKPAMFISCGIFDSNGALVPPAGYYRDVFARVRAAGGLCVADEVQSGLCRLGDHVWGFQDSGVIPDIVTLGKPIGDGHPLAAVVTTRAIAAAFARRFSYFNTFGGNPVSAAVGLAVLDVIQHERVLERVRDVGAWLGPRLRDLAERHPLAGDVRGKGLFWGVELVRDAGTRTPAPAEAARVRDALRRAGVLVGTSGPFGNVIKIRPPLVFARDHAELLVAALDEALAAVTPDPR